MAAVSVPDVTSRAVLVAIDKRRADVVTSASITTVEIFSVASRTGVTTGNCRTGLVIVRLALTGFAAVSVIHVTVRTIPLALVFRTRSLSSAFASVAAVSVPHVAVDTDLGAEEPWTFLCSLETCAFRAAFSVHLKTKSAIEVRITSVGYVWLVLNNAMMRS